MEWEATSRDGRGRTPESGRLRDLARSRGVGLTYPSVPTRTTTVITGTPTLRHVRTGDIGGQWNNLPVELQTMALSQRTPMGEMRTAGVSRQFREGVKTPKAIALEAIDPLCVSDPSKQYPHPKDYNVHNVSCAFNRFTSTLSIPLEMDPRECKYIIRDYYAQWLGFIWLEVLYGEDSVLIVHLYQKTDLPPSFYAHWPLVKRFLEVLAEKMEVDLRAQHVDIHYLAYTHPRRKELLGE